ncbi:MAG: endonuclease/exonuclease/phosphatase family protein [Parvularculaceae bacterium]
MFIWIIQAALSLLIVTAVFLRGVWPFEAIAGALTQIALVGVLFAALSFSLGRPAGAMLLIAGACLALWRADSAFERGTPVVVEPDVIIVWANLFTRQASLDAVQKLAMRENALVVAFGEFPAEAELRSAFLEQYPHRFPKEPSRNQDSVIFSKTPLEVAPENSKQRRSALTVRVSIDDAILTIVVMHPPVPWTPAKLDKQRVMIAEAFRRAKARSPYLIIGDFNATPWNLALAEASNIEAAPNRLSLGAKSTWLSPFPLIGAAIDHAYSSPDLLGSVELGPANGSDHFPIIVALKRK